MLVHLARAVQALGVAGFAPGATLGEVQFALRNGVQVPMHGGTGIDGTVNVVGPGGVAPSIQDPALVDRDRERLVAGSSLYRSDGHVGTPIDTGTSFLLAVAYGPDGPDAEAFLVYGQSEDRGSEGFIEATQRFAAKDWRTVEFTEEAVAAATTTSLTVRG